MDRWAGLLNYGSTENHTISIAMSRIEDWDFASDGVGCDANADNGTLAVYARADGEYSVDIRYAQFGIMSLSGRRWA